VSTVTRKPWTSDELVRLPAGWRYEIDQGELVIMPPAGLDHGESTSAAAMVLGQFVRSHRLGKVFSGEVGFRLQAAPETLRGADVAFLSNERLARVADPRGFSDVPPDLAVEVHDASEPDLGRKVTQYLAAGVRSVWVLDPAARTLTQHRPGEAPHVSSDPDAPVEDPVLPGFSCRLRQLFGED
jgi:Uma2 family endonuclease